MIVDGFVVLFGGRDVKEWLDSLFSYHVNVSDDLRFVLCLTVFSNSENFLFIVEEPEIERFAVGE